jgi:hypothetical protein
MDQKLSQQASTYEQAAMGLLALRFGDQERADGLFQFFKKTWDEGPNQHGPRAGLRGLANFYNAYFGTEGIEKTIHAGPNAWVGLFAAKYANTTKRRDALRFIPAGGGVVFTRRVNHPGTKPLRYLDAEAARAEPALLAAVERSTQAAADSSGF